MFLPSSSYMGQGVTSSRAIAHVRTNLPLNPSARTYRSKAGMAASHSSASPSTDSSTEHTQQAGTSGATSAAGMQQLFDTWMNAWRSLGTPPGASGMPLRNAADAPGAGPAANGFPADAVVSRYARLQQTGRRGLAFHAFVRRSEYSGRRDSIGASAETASRLFARRDGVDPAGHHVRDQGTRTQGPPLQFRGMERDAGLRIHRRLVSAERTLSAGNGRRARHRTEECASASVSRFSSGPRRPRRATSSH